MTTLHCRTFDLTAVRGGLAAALQRATFQGQPLRVNEWLADQWEPPCALVGTFTVEFSDSNYEALATATVSVRLIVPTLALRPAQQDLDAILGAYVDAIATDPTLGNTVMRALPVRAAPVTTAKGNQELASYDVETTCVL